MNQIERIKKDKSIVYGLGYARYSSDNQRDESIDAQVRAIEDYAEKNGIIIRKIYVDRAKSAMTDNRPEFQRMVADTKSQEVDVVIVHKLDRFARSRHDSIGYRMELKRQGVSLVSVLEYLDDESPESIILESVLEAMAEYYSKNLAREVKKGMMENALKCKHTGGLPPLGYDVDPKTKMLVINPEEAQAVQLIYDLFLKGEGYLSIANHLNRIGYRTKRGGPFGKNSILSIILNEKYTGTYLFNRASEKNVDGKRNNHRNKEAEDIVRVPDAFEAIIPRDIYEFALEKLAARKHVAPSNHLKHEYLLRGKVICGECGGSMCGSSKKCGGNKLLLVTYRCVSRRNKKGCTNKEIRREYIEAHVLYSLSRYLFQKSLIPKLVEEYSNYQMKLYEHSFAELRLIKKRHGEVVEEINNLLVLAAQVHSDSLAAKLEALEKQKGDLEFQLEQCKAQIDRKEMTKEELEERFGRAKSLLAAGELSCTKQLIELFIENVVVYKDRVDICFLFHPYLSLSSSINDPEKHLTNEKAQGNLQRFLKELSTQSGYSEQEIASRHKEGSRRVPGMVRFASTNKALDLTVEGFFLC